MSFLITESNPSPVEMDKEDKKEMLRQLPSYLATLDQAVGMMAQAVYQLPQAQPQEGTELAQEAPEGSQRSLVPPIPNRAPIGSLDNLIANMPRAATSPIQGTQGRNGGGGNRG